MHCQGRRAIIRLVLVEPKFWLVFQYRFLRCRLLATTLSSWSKVNSRKLSKGQEFRSAGKNCPVNWPNVCAIDTWASELTVSFWCATYQHRRPVPRKKNRIAISDGYTRIATVLLLIVRKWIALLGPHLRAKKAGRQIQFHNRHRSWRCSGHFRKQRSNLSRFRSAATECRENSIIYSTCRAVRSANANRAHKRQRAHFEDYLRQYGQSALCDIRRLH